MILYMHMMCFEQDQPQIPPFQTLLSSFSNQLVLCVKHPDTLNPLSDA